MANHTIYQLRKARTLSVRSFHVCEANNLLDLDSLLAYYLEHLDFRQLPGIGRLSNQELINYCEAYLDTKNGLTRSVANNNINQCFELRTLSARSFHVCEANNLLDLESLLAYYQEHFDFLQLRNIGKLSNRELIDCCEKYLAKENNEPDTIARKAPTAAVATPDEATPAHLQYLDHIVLQHFQTLSQEAKTYLYVHLDHEVNMESIYRFFKNDIPSLKFWTPNTGKKAGVEVVQFGADILQVYDDITTCGDFKFKQIQFQYWLKESFSLSQLAPADIEQSYCEGRLKWFLLLDALINSFQVFSKPGTFIFQKRFGYYEGDPLQHLKEIGEVLGLTRERVRQLACKVPKDMAIALEKLAQLPGVSDPMANYGWEMGNDLFFLTHENAQAISQAENVRFSQRFYTLFLWVQAKDSYQILPLTTNGTEHDYLVKSDLYAAFDFPAFLEDAGKQLRSKMRQSYFINMEEYLNSFLKNENSLPLLPRLKPICRELLLAQHPEGVPFDADGNICFVYPHKGPILQALAFQLLDSENRPMHVNEIFDRLKDHPDFPFKGNQIRQYLLQDSDRFIFFGKTSTYGLRKWESQQESIKGGTIRTMVEEYLEQHDQPMHISAITAHVQQYRPNTYQVSIIGNFQVKKNENILHFPGGFWGLATKNYHSEQLQTKQLPNRIKHHILRYLAQNGEVTIEALMSHFTEKLQVSERQLDFQLEKMLAEGTIQVSDEGRVRATEANP